MESMQLVIFKIKFLILQGWQRELVVWWTLRVSPLAHMSFHRCL